MPTVDLVVKNGRVIQQDRIVEAGLIVDEGKIVWIDRSAKPQADRVIDARGNLVIPGCIDIHVHSREPHGPQTPSNEEDFTSVSKAAASGGFTTVFDMPVTGDPPTTTVEGFEIKKGLAEKRCLVDYAFYGGVGFGNPGGVKPLAEAGVIGFKMFTRENLSEDGMWKDVILGEGGSETFCRVMREVAEAGLILSIHCEDDRLIRFLTDRLKAEGETKPAAYYKATPNASEFLEIARSISLSRQTGGKINIAHLSTAEGVSMVKNGKSEGLPVSAETCPHYLLLTDRDVVERLGPYGKMYPPLRTEQDRETLWKGLNDGAIDFLATDHAPHPKEAKEAGWEDIFAAAAGVPGLETALPLMLTEMNRGMISLFRLVEVLSRNPAGAFGIGDRKGGLERGLDADFVIVDLKREKVLREEEMYTRGSAKIFDGWRVKGVPVVTAVRGGVVMEDGEVVGRPGYGRYVSARRVEG